MAEFAHLHLHTQYSLLDGAIRTKELFKKAKEYGMTSVAMTDHGNMFGAVDFFKSAKAAGVKPIIGSEVYVARGDRRDKTLRGSHHMVLLARDNEGYKNLMYLVSMGFMEGFYYNPRIDKELLRKHSKGLIALTACLGGTPNQVWRREGEEAAKQAVLEFKEIFEPGAYFLEIQDNKMHEQEEFNRFALNLAKQTGLPLVATNDCHYLNRPDAKAHDVLMAIQMGKTLEEQRLTHSTDELYLKTPQEMWKGFESFCPEAIENAAKIGELCDVKIDLSSTYLPIYKVPEGHTLESYLDEVAYDGLKRRFREMEMQGKSFNADTYKARLATELTIIKNMKFPGYFLIVWDFIKHAKEKGIPVGPGRGSGAGSLVAYSLRITDLDPLPYDLLFERFLNPERVSMPDFDIDFCMNRRDEVVEYVRDKYGKNNVGQIITFGVLKAKSVIRDVGRTFGMPYGDVDRIAKLVPEKLNITLQEAIDSEPRLKEMRDNEPKVRELLDVALALEGLYRHAGMHAAGVVIGEKPLWEYVPLYRGANGELVTQFAKEEVEQAGLVKFDFLGLKTLTVIETAVKLVNQTLKEKHQAKGGDAPAEFDINAISLDDAEVYKLISDGDTTGVFQLESSGFKDLLKRLKPDRFEDIIAAVALYRPGPLEAGMVDDYIDRKHKRKPVSYPHASCETALGTTYGVIVYQEQVMQISVALCGFTLGGADSLRKAMGKKKPEEMKKVKEKFVSGAFNKSGMKEEDADNLFSDIEKFAGYAFNKSHSAAYALLTYQTGYLKRHHPVEFMAAMMTCDKDNTDKVVKFIAEARSMGISILPPDLNLSGQDFTVIGGKIRFGLGAVKGIGEAALDPIFETRTKKPFTGLFDFAERVDGKKVNKKVVEALVKCGAFDFTKVERAKVFAAIEPATERAAKAQKEKESGQGNLFSLFGASPQKTAATDSTSEEYPEVESWSPKERLAYEKECLGFYITGHPLDRFKQELGRYTNATTATLEDLVSRERGRFEVRIGGVVASLREKPARAGGRNAFFFVEDMHGQVEVLCFARTYAECEAVLKSDEPVLLTGSARLEGEGEAFEVKVMLEKAVLLSEVRANRTTRVDLMLNSAMATPEKLQKLKEIVAMNPGDCAISLQLAISELSGSAHIMLPTRVAPSEKLLLSIERIFGEKVAVLS